MQYGSFIVTVLLTVQTAELYMIHMIHRRDIDPSREWRRFIMDNALALLTLCGSVIALLFAFTRAKKVLKFSQGTDQMKKISSSIHQGAMAYLRRQYRILIIFFAGMFLILLIMAALGFLTWFVPFAFVTGGFFSGLSGFVGMQIATRANARTAAACQKGLNKGLNVAFSAGSVMDLPWSDLAFWIFPSGIYC